MTDQHVYKTLVFANAIIHSLYLLFHRILERSRADSFRDLYAAFTGGDGSVKNLVNARVYFLKHSIGVIHGICEQLPPNRSHLDPSYPQPTASCV